MKPVFLFLAFLFLLLAPKAQAQSIGQVKLGDRVFSTELPPWQEDQEPEMMSEERLEIALDCIRKTFGKIQEYKEYYGECCGKHHFDVILESGDELGFEEGILNDFNLVSPQFPAAKEWFKGGLRVGKIPPQPNDDSIDIIPWEKDPNRVFFNKNGLGGSYYLDTDGTIIAIYVGESEC